MNKRIEKLIKNQVLAVFGLKYGILRRRRNFRKEPIKLYWWHDYGNSIANFGDEITKDILLSVFGYRSVYATQNEAELIGAGSILEILSHRKSKDKTYVWGSGFMWRQEQKTDSLDNIVFCAVRGKLTRERLNQKDSTVKIGDPGLLANIVYDKAKIRTDKIGVVVHFVDSDEPLVQRIKKDKRFMLIDPLRSPEVVAQDITSCKYILSSSLHGLIFADSFGIPNIHIKLSNKVAGGTYKFEDYYSATGRSYSSADCSKMFDKGYIEGLMEPYRSVVNLRKIQRQLVKSFPHLR